MSAEIGDTADGPIPDDLVAAGAPRRESPHQPGAKYGIRKALRMLLRRSPGPLVSLLMAAALLLFLVVAAAAQEAADPFTIDGVEVDVTAGNAAEARDQAIVEAQRTAFQELLARLASPEDAARLPRLSDAEIGQMVTDFAIESERASDVRYIGKLTFRFREEAVRQYLERQGADFAATVSKPVLVLPVLSAEEGDLLWEEGNAWRAAWAANPQQNQLVPLIVPLGDLEDMQALDAQQALSGDTAAFAPLARRYGTGDTIVAEIRAPGPDAKSLSVRATRYLEAGGVQSFEEQASASETTPEALYAAAVERLSARVQDDWKRQNLVAGNVEQTLDVVVPIRGLSDWVAVQQRLRGIANVRRTEVVYLTRREGRLHLTFVGDQTQLTRALAQRDLGLSQSPESWILSLGAAGLPPATAGSGQSTSP